MDYIKVRDFWLQIHLLEKINLYLHLSDKSKIFEIIYKREIRANLTRIVELKV